MQNAPDLTLSPSEKRTLQRLAANDGFDASEVDWVALQRPEKARSRRGPGRGCADHRRGAARASAAQRMKMMWFGLLLATTALPVVAEEDWSQFHACLNRHKAAAEQAEPSLHEGARLVVDVLCLHEATA